MAIVTCYECGDRVSDRAAACPHCGAPMRSIQRRTAPRGKKKAGGAGAMFKLFTGIVAIGLTIVFLVTDVDKSGQMIQAVVLFWILFGLTFVTSIFGKR